MSTEPQANQPVNPDEPTAAATEADAGASAAAPQTEPVAAAAPPDSAAATAFTPPPAEPGKTGPELASIELLDDVELDVKVELGRAEMEIEDVLRLGVGSVIELDKLAGDPVDVIVNGRLVARGEVLVLNENFCVRINDIINPVPETATQA